VADLDGLFEHLESRLERRKRNSETEMLAFEPGGADTKPRPAAGENVESRDLLGEEARVAIVMPVASTPSFRREVFAAMNPSRPYASNISFSAGPTPGIWK
jgi:hypothetical protein